LCLSTGVLMRLPVLDRCCLAARRLQPATTAADRNSGRQHCAAATPAAPPAPAITPTADGHFSPDITIADFAAHVERLASDEFEGRKPGTIGERMTTTYLVDQFQRMGLKPGNKGSYLQSVPMVEVALADGDKVALDVAEGGNVEKFNFRTDTIVFSPQGKPEPRSRTATSSSPATASSRRNTSGTTTPDSTSRARPSSC
jgi:hypothetical protein